MLAYLSFPTAFAQCRTFSQGPVWPVIIKNPGYEVVRMAKIRLAVLLALASLSAMAAEDLAEGEEGYMDYTITSARIGL